MCNLYKMTRSVDEVAQLFNVAADKGANVGSHVYPGYPGWVVAEGQICSMAWGFPLTLKGKSGKPLKPKPVNNARADKLDSRFWNASFRDRRCLIPVSAFAEAEGPKGGKTRTWLSLPDQDVFACAGIWRDSDEWGRVYSMVMTEACEAMAEVHDRMPVILGGEQCKEWLTDPQEAALALCQPYLGKMDIERTDQPWLAQ